VCVLAERGHHHRVKIFAAALAVLLLTGCASETHEPDVLRPAAAPAPVYSSAVASTDPPAPAARCLDPGVEISIGDGDAATGLRFVGITLRNCRTRPYTVKGYPAATLLDAAQRTLPVRVVNGVDHVSLMPPYDKPPQRLVLAPGQTARAVVVWRNLTTDEATIVTGEYLRVAGARGQPTHLVALHVDLGNTGVLALSPWARP
jgi:hypothetical protein